LSFAWDIDVPADTAEEEPVEQHLKLTYGVITKIEVKFPVGCNGLVKVRLDRGGVLNILPWNPDEWCTGDDESVSYNKHLPLDDTPFSLNVTACSPGTTYDHTVTVRVEILPDYVASPWKILLELIETIRFAFGLRRA